MIFSARNEKNESTCDLVLHCKKTVTRRPDTGRMYRFGESYAVQRGRGKPSEGRILIVSVIRHDEWIQANIAGRDADTINRILQKEAQLEGFLSWKGLLDYMANHKININDTIRYRFKLISITGKMKGKK